LNPEDIGEVIDGDEILKLAQSFVVLVNYVEAQHAKCGKRVPE
jgi:hypothetical protein